MNNSKFSTLLQESQTDDCRPRDLREYGVGGIFPSGQKTKHFYSYIYNYYYVIYHKLLDMYHSELYYSFATTITKYTSPM